jgi:AraC-like DNA-binding protein
MVRERRSVVAGAVVWEGAAGSGERRVLPDGCMDLIWSDGELLVAGPDTRAHLAPAACTRTGLRFAPGAGPRVFGVPAHELRNRRVPLAALWSPAAVRQADAVVAGAPDLGAGLEAVAQERLAASEPPATPWSAVVRALRSGGRVERVAAEFGISPRQLHRRALDGLGYGPKTLVRILRLLDALELARAGVPYAETAARSGYADQAHLARDVKALAGVPLGTLTG